MLRIITRALFIVTLVFLSAALSFAGEDNSCGPQVWEPASAGPITAWTAPLCQKGKFIAQPFFFYNRTRGAFNAEGRYDSLPKGDKKYQYQQQLFAQYGLTERLEIDVQAVYQENFVCQSAKSAHDRGFGDSYLFLRYCAAEETDSLPHVTGLFQLKVPTGKYQHLDSDKLGADLMCATSGGGSYEHGWGVIATKKVKPFIFHADAILGFPLGTKVDGVKINYANYLNYDFGAEYFLAKGFNLMFELNGFLQGDKKENGSYVPASDVQYLAIASGIGLSCDEFQTLLTYQRTVLGTNTDANDSVIGTFVYTF